LAIPSRYTPQLIDLDHKLKPFIPDFIPAVGDIDAFLKVQMVQPKNGPVGVGCDPAVLTLPALAVLMNSAQFIAVLNIAHISKL
jgi:hypothetical protein